MDILNNVYIVNNLLSVFTSFLIAFLVSLFSVPLIGKLAWHFKAIDLPGHLRGADDKTAGRRIHTETIPRWGGLGIVLGIVVTTLITQRFELLSNGIVIGFFIVVFLGVLDDRFELSGRVQLILQFLSALSIVIIGKISITSIGFFDSFFDLSIYSGVITMWGFQYVYNLPADLITIFWIMAMMNVVNWVGGLDGLNVSISTVASLSLLIFALDSGNIILAIFIAMHIGGNLGLLPYNYNPAKIFPLSVGDYVNGYLLAVFAILGSTRWSYTFIILALPILDAIYVVLVRLYQNPIILTKPWKILSISGKNHLHHRLLEIGYSRKMVLFLEVGLMLLVCSIAIYYGISDARSSFGLFGLVFGIILSSFILIFFLNSKTNKKIAISKIEDKAKVEKLEVNVIIKDESKNEEFDEKYVY